MLNIHKPPRNKHNCCPTSDLWGWTEIINQGLPKRQSCGWLHPDRPTRKWGWFMIKACKHKHKQMLKHKVTHSNIQVRTELPCWLYILELMRVRWPGPFRVRGKGRADQSCSYIISCVTKLWDLMWVFTSIGRQVPPSRLTGRLFWLFNSLSRSGTGSW